MARPRNLVAALVTEDRAVADEAWGRLAEADIPATVITDPGMVGRYQLIVQVHRSELERAQALLTDLAGR